MEGHAYRVERGMGNTPNLSTYNSIPRERVVIYFKYRSSGKIEIAMKTQ